MRKILLTVMMVSSLLAFNACTKDGEQGPAGLTGPAGPAGAPGAVGAAGATGADGTKILAGDAAPAAGVGADGDYYFDKTAKTLYGPKAAGAWPAGTSLAGAAGADGATGPAGPAGPAGADGADGASFLAGAIAPGANDGKVGDYYFNTATSTFVGPKQTDGTWGANSIPLGSAFASKTYYLTRGLENVTQTLKNVSEKASETYDKPEIFSSYKVLPGDMRRINEYAGWGTNREMIFQSVPGSGVYDVIPQDGLPGTWGPSTLNTGGNLSSIFRVGAKFRYTQNFSNPTAEFTLTGEDIDRLTVDNGAAFGYLTYAKAVPSTVAEGKDLTFYRTKHVTVTKGTDADGFRAEYTAETNLNLNSIPGLMDKIESYKQDGKVYLKYRYVDPVTGNARYETASGSQVGWIDLTSNYLMTYTVQGATYGPDGEYTTTGNANLVNPFAAGPTMPATGAGYLGQTPNLFTLSANQTLTQINAAPRTQITNSGVFKFHWNISSGTNTGDTNTQVPFGPITLENGNGTLDVVGTSWNGTYPAGTYNRTAPTAPQAGGYWIPNTMTDIYYGGASLTANLADGSAYTPVGVSGDVPVKLYSNGRPASYFEGLPLVQVQVFVVSGDMVKAAQAKGINVNDAAALENFVKSN